MPTQRATWISVWAIAVIAGTFIDAIVRLGVRAYTQIAPGISIAQWAALATLAVLMTYVEGYRAVQARFAPSVVSRARAAGDRGISALLAPLYAVSLVGAPPRAIARTLFGITGIVSCIVAVRQLPSPWRGIVDAAVACALAWGLVALLGTFVAALVAERRRGETPDRVTRTSEAM